VQALVPALAAAAGLEGAREVAAEAARLSRADLATAVVTEMTALAGVMGRHYALAGGADPAVAQAIFESVLPRHAGDELPASPAGVLVSAADKLDSLVGLFAAGCAPTATADPYGLRRAAVGLLQVLLASGARLDLPAAVDAAAEAQPVPVPPAARAEVLDFVSRRLEQLLVDGGAAVEAVRAALAERGRDAALAAATAREASAELAAGEAGRLHRVMAAMARPVRLTRGKGVDDAWAVDPALFQAQEERDLHAAYMQAAAQVGTGRFDLRPPLAAAARRSACPCPIPQHLNTRTAHPALQISPDMSVPAFLEAAEALVAPLDSYFDKVFVMCEEEGVRRGRLALLRDVAALPRGILDLSELPGF
jgi:glycyl-tRNA synthetase